MTPLASDEILLLPHHEFTVKTPDKQTGQRFVMVFRRTWKKLPLEARRKIPPYWRQEGTSPKLWNDGVRDGFAKRWKVELLEQLDTETAAGCHTPEGLQFSLILFRQMPEEVAEGIIAHELGHAFLWAIDKGEKLSEQRRSDYRTDADAYFNDDEEVEVRRTTTLWGFDEKVVEGWTKRWIKRRERQKTNTSKRKGI